MNSIMGWDLGGAHVKAVRMNVADGEVLQIWHRAAPLWKGIERLAEAVQGIRGEAGEERLQHVVTMTGELADIFPNRGEGVRQIARCLEQTLEDEWFSCFSFDEGFIHNARQHADKVGSMNWYASAQLAAQLVPQGLFVDVGSTTTDLVPIQNHRVAAGGFLDAERLACQELLYTGVARTPLMSLGAQVKVSGSVCNVMAEHFATTADVYHLLGELPLSLYPFETADGAGDSAFESARRIARMIGRDLEEGDDLEEWVWLAQAFVDLQQQRILESLRAHAEAKSLDWVIGAGTGRFLLPALAARCGLRYRGMNDLLAERILTTGPLTPADCLAAYSVAELYRQAHAHL